MLDKPVDTVIPAEDRHHYLPSSQQGTWETYYSNVSSPFTIIVLKAPVSKERGQQLHDGMRIALFSMLPELKTRVH